MNQPKFYKTLVIILIILNLGTLFFMWESKPPHIGRLCKPDHHHLSKLLKLEGEAKEKVNILADEHHTLKKELIITDRALHRQLYELAGNKEDVSNILGTIHLNKKKIETMTFEYFDAVGNHCDSEQLKELKSFINTALNNLSGPRRIGPPRRP